MMELVDQIMRWWGIGIRRDQSGEHPQARRRSVWCQEVEGSLSREAQLYINRSGLHIRPLAHVVVAGCQLDDMRCCSAAVLQCCGAESRVEGRESSESCNGGREEGAC